MTRFLDLPAYMRTMSDLVTRAFQCDVTRVATLTLANGQLKFAWVPEPWGSYGGDWHGYASHAGDPGNADAEIGLDLYREGCQSQFAMFADLVRKLKNTPENDGTDASLLDNTILVCTSDMACGSGHYNSYLPVIVAGGSNLGVRTGRYIAAPPPEQPIYNLWVSMLNAVGVNVTSFGISTGAQPLG